MPRALAIRTATVIRMPTNRTHASAASFIEGSWIGILSRLIGWRELIVVAAASQSVRNTESMLALEPDRN